jgi:hypothetical protein
MGSTLMRPAFGALRRQKSTSELANAMVSPFALTPFTAVMLSMMFALSHDQLALIMTAGSLPVGSAAYSWSASPSGRNCVVLTSPTPISAPQSRSQ